ncbi:MAG TPA: DUF934 domain-containing protein [Burkholderiales bacterium]
MAILIKNRRIVADGWRLLDAHAAEAALADGESLLLPLALWLERRDSLPERRAPLGVWLDSHEGPEAIAADVARFQVIAVNFPKYQDGRGYSTARLLRERYGYRGELRAIGQVARDHLYYMASCGFDAFLLREGEDPQAALEAFDDFSEAYQASPARPLPLFRRRA